MPRQTRLEEVRMSLVRTLVVLVVAAWAAPSLGAGEAATANMEILRDTIRTNKKALVAASLTLSDTEAAQFWPAYERYQGELKGVNERLTRLIEDYTAHFKTLTDQQALDLIGQYLTLDEDRAKIHRSYLPEFSKVLPGRKVARLYQIENKVDVVLRYELAAQIPVVEE